MIPPILFLAESPVPLKFTPALGALLGVVITLCAVSAVVALALRAKRRRNVKGASNRGGGAEGDTEEADRCLRAAMPSE